MNIVIFACVDFPEGPATTSRVKLLSRILTEAGHRVSLAIFNANAKAPIPENRATHGIHNGVDYTYLSGTAVRPGRFSAALLDSFKGIVRSLGYLRQKKLSGSVDVVLFYTPGLIYILASLLQAKAYRIPILLELCELFSSDTRKAGILPKIKRLIAQLTDRYLPGACSGVLPISTNIIKHLKQRGLDDARILHLPILVDCERFMRPSGAVVSSLSGKRYFLNSGALDQKEGLEYILEAFAGLCSHDERLFLACTGAPDHGRKEYIRSRARSLGIDRKLIFTGFLSLDQLAWAYQNALALLCCRANTAFANYGFPTKLAEYLCSGRPVITNDVGDTVLYLTDGKNAYFARAEDSRSILSAMQRVVDSPEQAAEIGLNGRMVALKNFQYSNYIVPVDTFLRTMCEKGASSDSDLPQSP